MVPNTTTQEVSLGTPPDNCTEGLSPEAFYNAHMPVPKECFPAGIANLNAVAPFMGNHYVNLAEPVVAAFGKGKPQPSLWVEPSFIVGGWKGQIVFLEPMVRQLTLENLVKNANRTCYTPIIPAEMTNAGYYPTRFCIDTTTPGSIKVEMDTFKLQSAPGCNGTDYAPMSYIDALPAPPNAPPLPAVCKAPLGKPMAMAPGPSSSSSPGSSPSRPSSPGASPSSPSTPASSAKVPSFGLTALIAGAAAVGMRLV